MAGEKKIGGILEGNRRAYPSLQTVFLSVCINARLNFDFNNKSFVWYQVQ